MSYAIDPMRRHRFCGFHVLKCSRLEFWRVKEAASKKPRRPCDDGGWPWCQPRPNRTPDLIGNLVVQGPGHSRRAGWEKFQRHWWRCGLGVAGTIPGTALRGWIALKLGCLVIVPSRFDMKVEQNRFLRLLGQPPARLTAEQVAWALNCQRHDVPVLVAAKLPKPLGNPLPNRVKFYAALEVVDLSKDRSWLAKMTSALNQHWQKKNVAKRDYTAGLLQTS
jgi:hypothetical protein